MAPACWLCWLSAWEKAIPQLSPWCQPLQLLPLCHWCLLRCYPSAGALSQWGWGSSCVGSLRGTAWNFKSFFHQLNLCWFFATRNYGTLSSWHWNPRLGSRCGAGTPHFQDIPPKFLFASCGCETSLFHASALHTSLCGCEFFNSIVVRLPFNSSSEGSEWWFFYNIVVILMWLCKEASRVCLCHHLDWKSKVRLLLQKIPVLKPREYNFHK